MVPRELSKKGKSQILRRGRVPTYRFGYLAAELSWNANFVDSGGLVLKALEAHVFKQMTNPHTYARFCSIAQSSGMRLSPLLNEFCETHFLIPINLRPENSHSASILFLFLFLHGYTRVLGFPPADVAVRVFLTKYDSNDPEIQQRSYSRACHSLLSLFVHTADLIVTLGADNKDDRIVKFREHMSEGQTFVSVETSRLNFYVDVVKRAQEVRQILFFHFTLLRMVRFQRT
jgi:hypothetical protein